MTDKTDKVETAQSVAAAPKRRRFDAVRSLLPRRSPRLVAGLVIVLLVIVIAVVLPFFTKNPDAITNDLWQPPSWKHLLGTTKYGQDVLAQLGWSLRGSLIIGFSVALISLVISTIMGVLGTYIGHTLDELFSLITNVFLVLPALPLTIVIAATVRNKGIGTLIAVISITAWAGASRSLRAMTLSMRGRDYVLAGRIAGEHPVRIIVVEILPNLLPVMASSFTFSVIGAILSESSLSFMGLGAANQYSLGTMLFYAQTASALQVGAWWWFLPPGLMIALVGAGLSFINFALDEVINPRLRTLPNSRKTKLSRADRALEAARAMEAAKALEASNAATSGRKA
jgi:peptide/nickel transport system permease protein